MTDYPIADYDDAYANGAYIEGAADYPPRWAAQAQAFRDGPVGIGTGRGWISPTAPDHATGSICSCRKASPRVSRCSFHGGYWKAFDKSVWSHLAAGPLAHGLAVAMPGYTLCPDNRIAGIGREIADAVSFAASEVDGPIRLTGHSAGGQLVTRMISGTALSARSSSCPGGGRHLDLRGSRSPADHEDRDERNAAYRQG